MAVNVPQDIVTAVIALVTAVLGWLFGRRNNPTNGGK